MADDQYQQELDQLELQWLRVISLPHTDQQFDQLIRLFDKIHEAMSDPEFWR